MSQMTFIGKTDCKHSTQDMIRYGFEIPQDKYIIEVFDITKENYVSGRLILTNQQIELLINRFKGTMKEDKIPHLRKSLNLQKIKIVDKDFMVENMRFIKFHKEIPKEILK
jgi:hypothetical protein